MIGFVILTSIQVIIKVKDKSLCLKVCFSSTIDYIFTMINVRNRGSTKEFILIRDDSRISYCNDHYH